MILSGIRLLVVAALLTAQPALAQLNFGPMPDGVEQVLEPEAAERACRDGPNEAVCAWLGIAYLTGTGVAADTGKAESLLVLACGLGSAPGCEAYEAMTGADLPAQRALAQNLNLAACQRERGAGVGCFNAAQLYRIGFDVPQDLAKALQLYARGCDQGHGNSCNTLAQMEFNGVGGPPNKAAAFASANKGCELRTRDSCAFALMVSQSEGLAPIEPPVVATLFQSSCELGIIPACYNAGAYALRSLPVAAAKDQAGSFFARGCDGRNADSCFAAGVVARDGGERDHAAELFRKTLEIDPQHQRAQTGLAQLGS